MLSPDGWLRTGDLGVVDDAGRLRIVGRVKDMFIVGGFNVYPAEIENALLRHPAVRQAAVIGVPDRRLGEVGMAFVVTAPGTCDGRRHHRRGRVTRWPITRCRERSRSWTSSRSNATGKVLKDVLRERAAAGAHREHDGHERCRRAGGPHRPGRPARGRARRLGRRTLRCGPAGRLGRGRDQGGTAERRSDAPRLRVARHRHGRPEPRVRVGQPGQAQRGARPPGRGPAPAVREAVGDRRRLRHQPAARRARRARSRAGADGRHGIRISSTAA